MMVSHRLSLLWPLAVKKAGFMVKIGIDAFVFRRSSTLPFWRPFVDIWQQRPPLIVKFISSRNFISNSDLVETPPRATPAVEEVVKDFYSVMTRSDLF